MRKNKAVKIITIIFLSLSAWVIVHNLMLKLETATLDGRGTYVKIDNYKMHLYDSGEGRHTIVLLTGLGTGSPMLDFLPLSDALSDEFRIITVEPFGYGYSEMTNRPRTIENLVQEIRQALKKIDAKPPYILLPHSISGVYSYYWAAKFPKEITALIGNDCAVPDFVELVEDSPPIKERLVYFLGINRLAHWFFPKVLTPGDMKENYSNEMLSELRKKIIRTFGNRIVIDEWENYYENAKKAQMVIIAPSLPVLFFIADKPDFNSNIFIKERLKVLAIQKTGDYKVLNSGHYMHRTHSSEMAIEISDFIREHVD